MRGGVPRGGDPRGSDTWGGDTASPADGRPDARTDATSPWEVIRRINEAPWPSGVKHLMLALLQWRNAQTGEAYPGVETIAGAMSTTPQRVRRLITRALNLGALEAVGARTGGRKPTTYRLILPPSPGATGVSTPVQNVRPAHHKTFAQPTTNRSPTPAQIVRPPLHKSFAEPTNNQPENHQQQPGVVVVDTFAQLRIEDLRGHPNATPQRLAWIQRQAPLAKHPPGWARACIVEGWDVPEPSPEDAEAAKKAARDELERWWNQTPRPERRKLLDEARQREPRLADRVDGDFELTGVAKRILAERNGHGPKPTTPPPAGANGAPARLTADGVSMGVHQ